MQRDATAAIRSRMALALMLVAPALAVAHSKAEAPVELDAIVFKENGRIDAKVVAECDIEQELREAMKSVLPRKRSRRTSSTDVESRHLTLRIDKIGNLGSVGQAGTEFGVTAILSGHPTERLFLCRARVPLRVTHCGRISHCAMEIADDVAKWLNKLTPTHGT
jgi:hypothetical protein